MTAPSGAMPQAARAGHASHRTLLRGFGHSVTIAIAAATLASCDKPPTQQERIAQRAEQMRRDEDLAFRGCIDEVVGAFSAASVEVVRECRAHAKEVAGGTK